MRFLYYFSTLFRLLRANEGHRYEVVNKPKTNDKRFVRGARGERVGGNYNLIRDNLINE